MAVESAPPETAARYTFPAWDCPSPAERADSKVVIAPHKYLICPDRCKSANAAGSGNAPNPEKKTLYAEGEEEEACALFFGTHAFV
jgi:hypothetical protein